MDKLHSYQGFSGRFHEWRDDLKARYANWREDHEDESLVDLTKNLARGASQGDKDDYSHIYRSVDAIQPLNYANVASNTQRWGRKINKYRTKWC